MAKRMCQEKILYHILKFELNTLINTTNNFADKGSLRRHFCSQDSLQRHFRHYWTGWVKWNPPWGRINQYMVI